MNELDSFFSLAATEVEAELDRLLHPTPSSPTNLIDAMRWSMFAGGKRFRPALVFASGQTFGVPNESLVSTAAAIEMIHTYSLIHDDLPSMDDDDLRRGRETCHKKFGEATAILAGDALQAGAFRTIADDGALSEAVRVKLVGGLGRAASRMVAGQQFDLEAEGKDLSIEDVKNIHRNKTGALISFSVVAGAIIGDAAESEIEIVKQFGDEIGLLFQITDDLLDVVGSTESLGKTAGKDVESQKATYPSVLGLRNAKKLALDVAENAELQISKLGRDSRLLRTFVGYLLERRS